MTRLCMAILLCTFVHAAYGQNAAAGPAFEVASIKPSPPYDPRVGIRVRSDGGPGTKDPTLFTCENCSLASLISRAYDIPQYRLTAPEWMPSTTFVVTAKVPIGSTKEEFRLMLQSMLAERLKVSVHRESKEMPMYELVVAKGGPKLKKSADEPPPNEAENAHEKDRPHSPSLAADGYPTFKGESGMVMMGNRARLRYRRQTPEWFANELSVQLRSPVTDATGLTGNYDFALFWETGGARRNPSADANGSIGGADPDTGPTIMEAIQEQLGLKLVQKKGPVEILVVDHAEKVPTEN